MRPQPVAPEKPIGGEQLVQPQGHEIPLAHRQAHRRPESVHWGRFEKWSLLAFFGYTHHRASVGGLLPDLGPAVLPLLAGGD